MAGVKPAPIRTDLVNKLSIARLTPTAMVAAEHLEHVVALIHHVLPSLGPKYLRKFITNKEVHTLVLLVPEEMLGKGDGSKEDAKSDEDDDDDEDEEEEDEGDEEEDEEEEEDDDEGAAKAAEDNSPEAIAARKLMRRRIAGAVSYEYGERLGQRLLQVSLLAVRVRYQRLGVASKLVRALINGEAASFGRPEAAIAWADSRAIEFFKRHGFTEDPMLNARYREVSAPWARATLMSAQFAPQLPDLSGAAASSTAVASWVAGDGLHEQLEGWRKARLLEYSKELGLIERLHTEIRMLRDKVAVQNGHAAVLASENAKLKRENAAITAEFEQYRMARAQAAEAAAAKAAVEIADVAAAAAAASSSCASLSPAAAAADWIAATEAEAARATLAHSSAASSAAYASSSSPGSSSPGPSSPSSRASSRRGNGAALKLTWTNEQLQSELDKCKPSALPSSAGALRVRTWEVPTERAARQMRAQHEVCRAQLNEPSLVLRLFYGAPLSELQALLHHGFDDVPSDPHGLSVYGRGLYFCKYAHHAHHYTGGSGCVLVAEVAVGNAETVIRRDASRRAPSAGYDSIVVPGRPLPSHAEGGGSAEVNEEYVLFDGTQACPLVLIHYDMIAP